MVEENKKARKTHTSSAVKNKYAKKNYKRFSPALKFDLYERVEAYRAKEGISQSQFIERALDALEKNN